MNCTASGISYKYIPSSRFKTTLLSVTFVTALDKNAAANALALSLMSKGTLQLPDYYSFNRKLAGLYGASVSSSVSKMGDRQELNISLTVNDDKYSLDGEPTVTAAGELLLDMVFSRFMDGSSYPQNAVAREKRLLIEGIKSRFNDKRVYSRMRCEEIMCQNEAFGLSPNGTVADVETLTDADIKDAFRRIICESFISVTVVGTTEPKSFIEKFQQLLGTVDRQYKPLKADEAKNANALKRVEETMPVNQGKLVLGLRSNVGEILPNSVKTWVMTDVFGGGPYSKLFCNVREKMSLCYYCSARGVRSKGIIFVESGVEKDNIEAAEKAILDQLQRVKNGDFTEKELQSSKLALSDAFRSVAADQSGLAGWYDARIISGCDISPEEVAEAVLTVTAEDVIAAANRYTLDTVFALIPSADAKEEE